MKTKRERSEGAHNGETVVAKSTMKEIIINVIL